MSDFCLGFLSCFVTFSLFESLVIRFIYLSNIDLFFDLVAGKKNKDKLRNYFIRNN